MDDRLFSVWTDLLIDKAFDYRQIGISNEYCNHISEPEYGLKLHSWPDHAFEVVDDQKYMLFLLRYR